MQQTASHEPTVFRTERVLAHTPDAVYAAFEDGARLARWWGPKDFTNTFDVFEFRPGGRWEFTMHGPDGRDYANACEFRALEPGRRVVIEHVSPPHFTLTVTLEPHPEGTRLAWAQSFPDAELAERVRSVVVPSNEENLDRLTSELR